MLFSTDGTTHREVVVVSFVEPEQCCKITYRTYQCYTNTNSQPNFQYQSTIRIESNFQVDHYQYHDSEIGTKEGTFSNSLN